MESKIEVRYPFDTFQFISGNEKLYNFLNYLFKKAAAFNREMKIEKGDDFFPVCSFNKMSYSYDVEYEFFVKTYADYAEEIYDIDGDSVRKIYSFLYSQTDEKTTRFRYLFFAGLLGSYYRLGNGYFNDLSKNTRQIFFEKAVRNQRGEVARSRVVMIRNFIDEHIRNEDIMEELQGYELEQVAYGLKKVKTYEEEQGIGRLPKIYNLIQN